jgi:hypothetical protein
MQVQVERRPGHLGGEMPVRFRFGGREIEIVENVDQWYGPDYCYFKMQGNDGNLYILRFDEGRVEWDLTMFQSPQAASAHAAARQPPARTALATLPWYFVAGPFRRKRCARSCAVRPAREAKPGAPRRVYALSRRRAG